MFRNRNLIFLALVFAAAVFGGAVVSGETFHLDSGGELKAVSQSGQGRYLLAAAEIKNLVDSGDVKAVKQAAARLKDEFSEFSGPDWQAFMAAEILYCKGKFAKAARSYEKFLDDYPVSDFREAAMERVYSIGVAFLSGQKISVLGIFRIRGYTEGAKLMGKISDRAGDSAISVRAAKTLARSYEKRGKYNDAHMEWSFISSRWPTGELGREALLNMARCKHAAYKGPKYETSCLVSAKSYYQNFKMRYPREAQEYEIDEKLAQIEEQMAYKKLIIGEYYNKTGDNQSANFYYEMVKADWPGSTASKMANEKN